MKRAFKIIGLALALLLAFSSCQKAPFLTFAGQKSFTFKDAGGSETITFSCNRAWTATTSESWLTVSPAKGDANEEGVRVTITCAANTTYDSRNATVTISSEGLTETISVSQDTNYGLMSEPTTFNLTNEAQNIEVEVKANVEYTITIDDACKDWISQVGTKALSSTKLTFSIAANESYDDREGKITISQKGSASSVQPQVIIVKQSQTNGLFITTPEYELSNEAHDLTIEVKANINYEVTSEVDWIKYEASSTKALSATTFTLKVDKNETYDQRVGTVKVKGGGLEGIITITQAESLGLFVSPAEVQISKDAQEVEVEVQANVEYDIIVPEEAKGMITTIKTEGGETKALVAKKVRFGISENPKYERREASVTFKQMNGELCGTYKISQEQRDTLFVTPQKDSISWEGGDIHFDIISNVEYSVAKPESANWITAVDMKKGDTKEGLTTYSYSININPNEDTKDRVAEFSFENSEKKISAKYELIQGGVPIINFVDKYAKMCCVEHFDVNGDDEISMLEANNVTSFPDNFFGDYASVISSFEEFQFFNIEKTYHTFFMCTNLQKIVLPSTLKELGGMTFYGCSNLSSVSVPESVTRFGDYAFAECSKLSSVTLPSKVDEWGDCMFMDCFYLTQIKLPIGIKNIGTASFAMCRKLTKIDIPSGVISIGENAFKGCTSLNEIRFPNSLLSLGNSSFANCTSLEKVILPEGLISIMDRAFTQCDRLANVYIPNSVNSIGSYVFDGCPELQKVELPNSITEIPHAMFQNCYKLTDVVIPNSVTKISRYAFWACKSLTTITLPENITEIYDGAFWACTGISSVYSYSTLSPILHNGEPVFTGISSTAVLYVPKDCSNEYSTWAPYFGGGIIELP